MGNCQAAEAVTVVIQNPVTATAERIYWSVSAREVMRRNPGHYVALVLAVADSSAAAPVAKRLKLLRPDETLLVGHVYRLVSFQDVLKEFAAKKCVKLGKLLKERGGLHAPAGIVRFSDRPMKIRSDDDHNDSDKIDNEVGLLNNSKARRHYGTSVGQWKPALQSIAEVGTTS